MELPQNYDHQAREKHWQRHWLEAGTYHWDETASRKDTYVIDTPPPTVSGMLHMGHIFSYVQADFVARYQRMRGKTVFYPMGFDDNGLPTERLVEKTQKIRAADMSREEFITRCMAVSEEARKEYRMQFEAVALSVDWRQEYHTISEESRRLSQMSFLDLLQKGHVYRKLQPMLWDPVDQTAIAQAEIEDKELPSHFNDLWFEVVDAHGAPLDPARFPQATISEGDEIAIHFREIEGRLRSYIVIGTTRPELLPACVAVFHHPDDARYQPLAGCQAITPLFGVRVPILADDTVEPAKGSGIMMCCTFGDEKDIEKWRKHDLPTRVVLNKFGKLDFSSLADAPSSLRGGNADAAIQGHAPGASSPGLPRFARNDVVEALQNLKASNADPKHPGARQKILELLGQSGDLIASRPITHAVKCAERSGAPLEILPTHQWFVRILDKKDALKAKSADCAWHPDWMRLRMDQWIDGLNWDWCISRQRYFGVPFPVWYRAKAVKNAEGQYAGILPWEDKPIVPSLEQLPVNPLVDVPAGYEFLENSSSQNQIFVRNLEDGQLYTLRAEADVMDTWATSSISPQLSSKGISSSSPLEGEPAIASASAAGAVGGLAPAEPSDTPPTPLLSLAAPQSSAPPQGRSYILDTERHGKLYPADLRPQAHEIIRSWAFYTIVKSLLHEDKAPWRNLMISGWCLAADKTKMSKSKGNVVTPVELIRDKGTDPVRYWASTSRLGADTAFSEDALKIGKKLVTKLWNASKFAATQLAALEGVPVLNNETTMSGPVYATLDQWILSQLVKTEATARTSFDKYEYAEARAAIEDFFWNDFCDNYLELVKARAYGNETPKGQQSALHALYHCLNGVLKMFAPFVPHICEELFSYLFPAEYAANGSVHARGMWPDYSSFLWVYASINTNQAAADAVGLLSAVQNAESKTDFHQAEDAIGLLANIRKAKSERGVSIKTPVARLEYAFLDERQSQVPRDNAFLEGFAFDLKAAGSIAELVVGEAINGTVSEDGRYRILIEFAEESDVA